MLPSAPAYPHHNSLSACRNLALTRTGKGVKSRAKQAAASAMPGKLSTTETAIPPSRVLSSVNALCRVDFHPERLVSVLLWF